MIRVYSDGRFETFENENSYDLDNVMVVDDDFRSENFQLFIIKDCLLEVDFRLSMVVKFFVRYRMIDLVIVIFYLILMEQ